MDQEITKFLNKTFILAAILVAGILIFLVAVVGYQQQYLGQQNQNQITVSGEGKVYAKPDVATVSFGVTTQATTVADVTKSNTEKMNTVIKSKGAVFTHNLTEICNKRGIALPYSLKP